jgi:hypothetical protein
LYRSRIKSENARARIDSTAGLERENTADREVITILMKEHALDSTAEKLVRCVAHLSNKMGSKAQ